MTELTINLDAPIESVSLIDDTNQPVTSSTATSHSDSPEDRALKAKLSSLCRSLENILQSLQQFQQSAYTEYKNEIAKLAVEIASKVLASRIRQKDYEIEAIIRDALEGLTVKQDIVVRLNPEDHEHIEQLLKQKQLNDICDLAFVPDENIEPAQCIIETPQGIIESIIEEKLKCISEALEKIQ